MLAVSRAGAQYDVSFSHYWDLEPYYNAGAAGIYEKLNLRAATRQQWVGMPGAPKSFLALADMPLRFLKADHGVGLMLANDSYGLFKTTSLGLQYAYKVRLWGGQLSLGLQLGLVSQTFDERAEIEADAARYLHDAVGKRAHGRDQSRYQHRYA